LYALQGLSANAAAMVCIRRRQQRGAARLGEREHATATGAKAGAAHTGIVVSVKVPWT